MRQFGLYQSIPPPRPFDWVLSERLHRIQHSSKNWATVHARFISQWGNLDALIIEESRPYNPNMKDLYKQWFDQVGMCMIFQISAEEA